MTIVYLLAPLALALAGSMLLAFLWAARAGQYEDLETPAHRMLLDSEIAEGDISRRDHTTG
jgi:cbb3-type cytochrome oxidase maturation protein